MIHIAIVEDEPKVARQIEGYIQRFADEQGHSIKTTCFSDGDEIALHYSGAFNIILLDIQMAFMDGMTAAEIIREHDEDVTIIFVTNMANYAVRGYSVNALDFILKPIQYFSFCEKLENAIRRRSKSGGFFLRIPVDKGFEKIDVASICHIESQGHKIEMHTRARKVTTYSTTIAELEAQLTPHGFFRCNKGCLVNLHYVTALRDGYIMLQENRLLLSRGKKGAFMEALNEHIGNDIL